MLDTLNMAYQDNCEREHCNKDTADVGVKGVFYFFFLRICPFGTLLFNDFFNQVTLIHIEKDCADKGCEECSEFYEQVKS